MNKGPKLDPIGRVRYYTRLVQDTARRLRALEKRVEDVQLAVGRIEVALQRVSPPPGIRESEFKVFSQNGEDGILQYLLDRIPDVPRLFVEFGVQDYKESNTRFLLKKDYWRGLIIDADADAIAAIEQDEVHWRHQLQSVCSFITAENINDIIRGAGFAGDIGVLSVDIDGNDYWVWRAIDCVRPMIVVTEYNAVFGPRSKVSIPYNPKFVRETAHPSLAYWGASLGAFHHLAARRGYSLVGCNMMGNNAFWVRDDRLGNLKTFTPEQAFVPMQAREYRDATGRLIDATRTDLLRVISELPLVEVERDEQILVGALLAGS